MQNWNVDPKTGDYVMERGSPQQTDSLTIPAYIRLKTKRKKWLYAPNDQYGSDFYTVKKRPAENANQRLEKIAVKALQPIVDDGRASTVEAKVVQNSRHATGMQISIKDASGEIETQTFQGLGL